MKRKKWKKKSHSHWQNNKNTAPIFISNWWHLPCATHGIYFWKSAARIALLLFSFFRICNTLFFNSKNWFCAYLFFLLIFQKRFFFLKLLFQDDDALIGFRKMMWSSYIATEDFHQIQNWMCGKFCFLEMF